MVLARALVVLLLLVSGLYSGGLVQARAATAPAAISLAAPAAAAAAAEESSTQVRVLEAAYNLLLDRYVHPLDSAKLLRAGWDELGKDAAGKAPAPAPLPELTGDRAADLERASNALSDYLARPEGTAEGFVAAHSLVEGMVRFVDEGHTYFLDPQQYQDYQAWARGESKYVGIGISVSARGPEPRINEVFENTPAERAGLKAGDILVTIGGQPVAGLALDEMTSLVRGPSGSSVELVVRRGDSPDPLPFLVTRAEIQLQFVRQRLWENIGYVSLRGFPEPSVVETIERNVATFEAQGVRGLVLDLRGNSGGRIDVGTRLLSHFLPPGSTVYEEVGRAGQNRMHFSRSGRLYDLPLVVLVDGSTASMGEIFASAVQEHGAATVLGTTTAGSVAAAQVFGLPDGAGLQITVYEIRTPDGRQLNRVGVVPDEVIESDPTSANDSVLNRAVEILNQHASSGPG